MGEGDPYWMKPYKYKPHNAYTCPTHALTVFSQEKIKELQSKLVRVEDEVNAKEHDIKGSKMKIQELNKVHMNSIFWHS